MSKSVRNNGFTVPEVLISSATIILVMLGAISFYIMAQSVWIDSNARIALQRDARIAMERMVRDIHQSTTASLPNSYTINYTSGIDGKERSFYLSGGQIWHDPDTSVGGNEFSIAKKTQAFLVSDGSIITINLVMQDTLGSKILSVFLYTQVRLRN